MSVMHPQPLHIKVRSESINGLPQTLCAVRYGFVTIKHCLLGRAIN